MSYQATPHRFWLAVNLSMLTLLCAAESFALSKVPGKLVVCLDSSGNLNVRKKCRKKKGEVILDMAALSVSISAKGEQGETGPAGKVGPAGPIGPQGKRGPTGAQGPKGENGDRGPIGLQGEAGEAGLMCWDLNGNGVGDLKGEGEVNEDINGDGEVSVKDCSGLQGPQGNPGPKGATGAQGPQGVQGPAGPAGAAGATGPQGVQGPAGPAGAAGATGPQGVQGPAGPQGAPGMLGVYYVDLNKICEQNSACGTLVYCNSGDQLIGGGFYAQDHFYLKAIGSQRVVVSANPLLEAWKVSVVNTTNTDGRYLAQAICADVTP